MTLRRSNGSAAQADTRALTSTDNPRAVSPFERYANGGDDPKLKDWAGKALPALKHHLEMAQALDKKPSIASKAAYSCCTHGFVGYLQHSWANPSME
jgi:hypothetical protein